MVVPDGGLPEDWRAALEAIAGRLTEEQRFERGLDALLDGAAMRLGLPPFGR